MKQIIKNLYMILTALSLVALVVFIVQLIVINSGTEIEDNPSVILGSASLTDGGGSAEPENPFVDYEPPPPTPRPIPQGVRNEIPIYEDMTLVIYSQSELFEFTENEFDWLFRYRGGGNAALEISYAFLSTQVGADAEAFLNRKTDGSSAEYKGAQEIIDSQINAFSVTARSGGVTYEAWLHRIPDTELAIAFLITFEFNDQRDELYNLLSTISIITPADGQGE